MRRQDYENCTILLKILKVKLSIIVNFLVFGLLLFTIFVFMNTVNQPLLLKKGDKISIICSARKISREEVEPAIKVLQDWGLKVVLGDNLFKIDNQFAGNKNDRSKDLQKAIDDPEIKAILFARGGYGSVQIVDHINWESLLKKPKWLIGYSDITVFHSHVNKTLNIETIHSWMPLSLVDNKTTTVAIEALKKILFEGEVEYEWNEHSLNKFNNKAVEGELVGGNLSILCSLSGSNSQLSLKDKILFIEDLDEYLYHIDRMMMNLKRSKLFEGCKAVIVGGMSDMNDNKVPFGKDALEIICDNLKSLDIPVVFNFPAGHIEDNRPLIFGRMVTLSQGVDTLKLKFNGRA